MFNIGLIGGNRRNVSTVTINVTAAKRHFIFFGTFRTAINRVHECVSRNRRLSVAKVYFNLWGILPTILNELVGFVKSLTYSLERDWKSVFICYFLHCI